jgi:hypothetical protein
VIGTGISHPGYDIDLTLVEPCGTRLVGYRCPAGHHFELRFAAEADEVPTTWSCRCGSDARTDAPDAVAAFRTRAELWAAARRKTHSDMLHERRTVEELEALLAERLAALRGAEPGRVVA